MNDDFIEDNKKALFEEMGKVLNNINSFIDDFINIKYEDGTLIETMTIMAALSNQIGYLTSTFNQLYILKTGVIPKNETKQIGFLRMLNKKEPLE